MFSSQSAAERGCGEREGFLGQLANGRKCIGSSFQSIRSRVSTPRSETLEVSCPPEFLVCVGPQSLSHALHSLRSPLCRRLTSLLTIHDAESPGLSHGACSQQACRQRSPSPSPWPRLASPEGLCLLLGEARGCPFTVPSSEGCCPSFLSWDSIPTEHPLGGSASSGDVSQEVIHHK